MHRLSKSFFVLLLMHACSLLIFLASLAFALPAEAQMRGKGRMGMGEGSPAGGERGKTGELSAPAERREGDLQATGLVPVFPDDQACEQIASGFASPTRHDGSRRPSDRFGGLHGGLDITLKEGTPLLAIAAGKIIAKGTGAMMEGHFLWLQHAPADTGLPYWTHSKYQHLAEVPPLAVGESVRAGQAIALAGSTGTAGGHYGASGYPHLHLSTHIGPSGEFELAGAFASMVRARGAKNSDPLLLFLPGNSREIQPEGGKPAPIAIVGADGSIHPPGSKVVWPVACRTKDR